MDNFDLKKYLVENKVTTNSKTVNEGSKNPFAGLAGKAAKEFIHASENGVGPARFVKAMFQNYREWFGEALEEEGTFYEYTPQDAALLRAIGEEDLLDPDGEEEEEDFLGLEGEEEGED